VSRVVKKPEERKSEIINAAIELFAKTGYEKTSIEDIIKKVKIAKGTFYYYFKSKMEILEYVVDLINKDIFKKIDEISCMENLSAIDKLKFIFFAEKNKNIENLMEAIHHEENIVLHEKLNTQMILSLSPIIQNIVIQGIKENVFHVDNVKEVVEFLLCGTQYFMDESIFQIKDEEKGFRLFVMIGIIEKVLGAEKDLLVNAFIKGENVNDFKNS